ncbi:MAG: homoserine dehydrogenase [Candidatus Thermoplasmatota archaeon]|nr:homoserine dehydrogenase [Candidatus Thermoplasmatota archaeon]
MSGNSHNILIIGFGTVGQGFFELFNRKKEELGLQNVKISEIADMRYGHIKSPGEDLLQNLPAQKTPPADVLKVIRESSCDIVCEFTWVDFKTGGPGYDHIKTALSSGKHVITTNKGPITTHYDELNELAVKNRVKLRFKGTVMAGTPSFNLLKLLPGAKVLRFRGILNGTTNYILNEMSIGKDFEAALRDAQQKGYAAANPTNDVDGFDSAAKCAIISRILGWPHDFNEIEVKGIREVTAQEARTGTKLLVYGDPKSAYVKPVKLPGDDLLSSIRGVTNAIEFETDTLGKIYSVGPGAGRIETAQAAMTDLLDIISL